MSKGAEAVKYVRTACVRDCPDACGIIAAVSEGRVIGLSGDPDHPITKGFLCYRASQYLKRQYSPERVTTPLRKTKGSWKPLSWEDALDLAAERLRYFRDTHGGPSILYYYGTGSLGALKALNRYFFQLFGNVTMKAGDVCAGAGVAAQIMDMGESESHDRDDLANARTVVLWGKNVCTSSPHLIPILKKARRNGSQLILIDPIYDPAACKMVDAYYQPRPGSVGALTLGMAQIILDNGWADPEIENYVNGFEGYKRLVYAGSKADYARQAGLSTVQMEELTHSYALGKPAAILVGWGLQRYLNGASHVRLIDALAALTGNVGIPGGGVSFYFQRRKGFKLDFLLASEHPDRRLLLEPLLGQEILSAEDPPIKMAWIDAGNPVNQLPDSRGVAKAFESLEFVVVLDQFLTDTASYADLFLPVTTFLEETDVIGAYGHHFISAVQPAVPPPDGVLSDMKIYQLLAGRLGFGHYLEGEEVTWINRLLERPGNNGLSWDGLREKTMRRPDPPYVMFPDRRFSTPSGRFEFIQEFTAQTERDQDYPLRLLSVGSQKWQNSQVLECAHPDRPDITVHPEAVPGFRDDESARIVSRIGSLVVRMRLDDRQRRDVVIFHRGLWNKFGCGVNTLIRARSTDHGGGAAYYDEWVRIEKCEESKETVAAVDRSSSN
jgi:anaerobic selenocysteine-containing dehydrogenase